MITRTNKNVRWMRRMAVTLAVSIGTLIPGDKLAAQTAKPEGAKRDVPANPPINLQAEYLKVYFKMYDARELVKQGQNKEALNFFMDCYIRLEKIHFTDPNWESALITQRMADCQKEIHGLEPQGEVPQYPPTDKDITKYILEDSSLKKSGERIH